MTLDTAPLEPSEGRTHDWRSILQAVLSFLAAVIFMGQGIVMLVMDSFSASTADLVLGGSDSIPISGLSGVYTVFGVICIVVALLLIPSGIAAISRLRRRALPAWLKFDSIVKQRLLIFSIILVPLVLAMDAMLAEYAQHSATILLITGVFGIGLPVVWLVSFGQHGLKGGSSQRKWGVFGFSLSVTTGLIIAVELLAILVGLLMFTAWAMANPQIIDFFTNLANLVGSSDGNLESIMQELQPYLRQPLVIFVIFTAVSVITPLIEEVLKTLGVWLFVKRQLTPAEGYVAGLICGAGFALMEGLLSLANITAFQDLALLVIGRAGGSLLHIFTGGIIGWGLAQAWRTGRMLKYLLAFFGAMIIHALWNALAILSILVPMFIFAESEPGGVVNFLLSLPTIVLGLAVLVLFVVFTLRLRKQAQPLVELVPPG